MRAPSDLPWRECRGDGGGVLALDHVGRSAVDDCERLRTAREFDGDIDPAAAPLGSRRVDLG